MARSLILAALLAAACNNDGDPGTGFSSGVSTAPAGSSSSGEGPSSTSSSTSGEMEDSVGSQGDSSGAQPDMGTIPDFGDPQPPGCKGKIDFLFLIARNGTMVTEQAQLLASFDGFMQTIEARFSSFDTHMMVANPDGVWNGETCESADLCGNTGSCSPYADDYVCGSFEDNVWPCDEELGAGLLFNVGPNATNHPCALHDGNRYIVADEPDRLDAFKCIATVGTWGKDPPLLDALAEAVSSNLNGEGGCNAGFLRDDALLVVVTIMDTEDVKSSRSPAKVYEAIVAAKKDPDSVVMLAITAQPLVGDPQPDCTYNDGDAKIRDLVNMFEYRREGDTCAASYAPFFEAAAGLVDEACNSFIPQ